jgi:hypothetical protein
MTPAIVRNILNKIDDELKATSQFLTDGKCADVVDYRSSIARLRAFREARTIITESLESSRDT